MSWFLAQEDEIHSDEIKVNNFINSSLSSRLYSYLTKFIQNKICDFDNDKISKILDNTYFTVLAALLFSIPIANTTTLGFLSGILILISIFSSLLTHKSFKISTIHIPVIIYLAILLVSVFFSSMFFPSLKGFAKMLLYIGAYFSFFEFLKKDPKRILPVIGIIAISASIEILFSLKQIIFGVDELASWQDKTGVNPENMMNRIYGTLKPYNPNLLAAYLLVTTPCIFIRSAVSFINKYQNAGITFLILGFLGLITIIQTGCRGAYIGIFAGFLFLCVLTLCILKTANYKTTISKKAMILAVFVVIIAITLAIISSPSLSHRLASIFTFRGDSSNSYRMNVYISSAKMFWDNFWIGIGPGNTTYRLIYGLYMVTGFDALGAYNIYLEMGVESGIFALFTFIWMIILTFKKGICKLKTVELKSKIIAAGCLIGIFCSLMHGIVDTIWYRPQLQLVFWLYMAIIAVITMKDFQDEKQ